MVSQELNRQARGTKSDLRPECQVSEDSNDLVDEGGAADGRANDNVHSSLGISLDLVEYGEQLHPIVSD